MQARRRRRRLLVVNTAEVYIELDTASNADTASAKADLDNIVTNGALQVGGLICS